MQFFNVKKKKFRFINFYRYKKSKGIVFNIEYDPNRNSSIAAVFEIAEKNFFYIKTKTTKITLDGLYRFNFSIWNYPNKSNTADANKPKTIFKRIAITATAYNTKGVFATSSFGSLLYIAKINLK